MSKTTKEKKYNNDTIELKCWFKHPVINLPEINRCPNILLFLDIFFILFSAIHSLLNPVIIKWFKSHSLTGCFKSRNAFSFQGQLLKSSQFKILIFPRWAALGKWNNSRDSHLLSATSYCSNFHNEQHMRKYHTEWTIIFLKPLHIVQVSKLRNYWKGNPMGTHLF